ncbi:hypothetical protein KHO57_gp229 [Mycobacterium phage Phabba]|uniref:Uncharacterized protein n=1 Tax=Mycobacterium phage Phabba TaxID=2027899 RepID=A0A249XSG0_9CAUD|nr:hypothetical protein KHO57_gp229 [Mycobacterium phage Phabba]ASZ74675.1 hypothetical protein SEA_PHABBA_106 [Mycobacterium phage Phabba]
MPRSFTSARDQAAALSPWRTAYDIQSPAPGAPMQTKRGPSAPSIDPTNDPMGNLNKRPYDYGGMVDNLVSHYHGSTDDEKKSGRLWYKAAHDLFHNFAKKNDISPERAVAYGAAFSPLTDWGDNVHHAQKFMLGYTPDQPGFNKHDWQQAHIHPQALDAFRQQNGRDPSHSTEDLHQLADMHQGVWGASQAETKKGLAGKQDIANNPEARQEWIDNIQHKGMDATLADHMQQRGAHEKSKKGRGGAPFDPSFAMRSSGINTLGGNIAKAKDLYHAPDDIVHMFKVLGGPKISHFTDNILDDTPIDEEGYYQHPNGDWTQNKDLGGTIDSHHMRAAGMAHGQWERKPYAVSNPSTDHEYDVYNRGLFDATKRINEGQADPSKHITPKQLQAIVWLKHKNDKDYFERQKNPETGQKIVHESELGGAGRPEDWQFAEKSYKSKGKGLGKGPGRAAALQEQDLFNMPPLWRQVFLHHQPQEWTDLLDAWVDHHSPAPGQPDGNAGDPRMQDPRPLHGEDPHLARVARAHMAAFDDFDSIMQGQSFPHQVEEGPHDSPWKGQHADELAGECAYCHSAPGELCDPHCPTNHSDSPRDWAMDAKALGGSPFKAVDDTMHRLNSVNSLLRSVDDLLGG